MCHVRTYLPKGTCMYVVCTTTCDSCVQYCCTSTSTATTHLPSWTCHVWGTCSWLRRSAISVHDKRNVRRHRNQTRARNEDLDLIILFSVGLNFFAICFVPTPISALAIFATVLHCFASATFAEFGKR